MDEFILDSSDKECQFKRFYFDVSLLRETAEFTGWTLFGQVSTVTRNQAVTILVNQVYNPVVVAVNVSNFINVFSNNFNMRLYLPIIKEYSIGNKGWTFSLIFTGLKMTFFDVDICLIVSSGNEFHFN